MTWLDSDGKYYIMLGVHIRDNHHVYNETIIFKNIILIISYNEISVVVTTVNIYSIIIWSPSVLSESLLIKIILFLYFTIYFIYKYFNDSIFIELKLFYFSK